MQIKQFAQEYIPQQMKNIADLEVVRCDVDIKEEVRKDSSNEDYKVMFIVIEGEEYRVPGSVVTQLKGLIEVKPDITSFKVKKTGTGLGTSYQVIEL